MFLSQVSQDSNKTYATIFSPFWNEIIKSLREEDFISNRYIAEAWYSFPEIRSMFSSVIDFVEIGSIFREKNLLSMPSNTGSLRLVQWPLFLLSRKVQSVYSLPIFHNCLQIVVLVPCFHFDT